MMIYLPGWLSLLGEAEVEGTLVMGTGGDRPEDVVIV